MVSATYVRVAPLVLGVLLAAVPAGPVAAAGQTPASVRIGTCDSRAVALAYYRSPDRRPEIAALRAELEKAKAAGDETKVKEAETRGQTLQMLMHQQVFSSGSIGNITPSISSRLPEIARAAGVVAIVSRWELPHTTASVEVVDLTPQIVALFAPDQTTMKMIEAMKDQKPISLVEALGIKN